MASWFLVPCLVQLRSEFNDLNPKRDKGADGSIGDAAHASGSSDHNPDSKGRVLAVDIDSSGPWPAGTTFDAAVTSIAARCRSGDEDRIEYIIWNRFIYSRSAGFAKRTYTGTSDPHTNHAHFSARHDHHGESDTRAWGLLEKSDMTPAEMTAWAKSVDGKAALVAAAATGAAGAKIGRSETTIAQALAGLTDDQAATARAISAAQTEILAAVRAQGIVLSDDQVRVLAAAMNNAVQSVLDKLTRAGAALTQ